MTPHDLSFLKGILSKTESYNKLHKTIRLVVTDSWNSRKDRYDYTVSINTSLDPSNPKDKKSIDKAVLVARGLNGFIFTNNYSDIDTNDVQINYTTPHKSLK